MGKCGPSNRSRKARGFGGTDELAREIASLSALGAEALRRRWRALFGTDPSLYLGPSLMVQLLAYRIQERALGGLKPATLRILDRVVESQPKTAGERAPVRRASAGTVLIRQWRGVHHRVTVLDHDVVYRGRRYRSLSEVARAITGTHWSGPAFFGLKRRAEKVAHG